MAVSSEQLFIVDIFLKVVPRNSKSQASYFKGKKFHMHSPSQVLLVRQRTVCYNLFCGTRADFVIQ